MILDRSRAPDRSVYVPRSRGRLLAALAIAVAGPALVAPISVSFLERLPAIPYYVVIALAARFGRIVGGVLATIVSGAFLITFSFEPSGLRLSGDDALSVAAFAALSTMITLAISFERASSGRVQLAQRRLELLADATSIVQSDLDPSASLQRLAERIVPELADWCAIHALVDGELVVKAVAHPDPERMAMAWRLQDEYPPDLKQPGGIGDVLRTGVHLYVPEITEEMARASARDPEHLEVIRSLGMRSAIAAPLTARGQTFGVMTLIVAEGAWRYDEQDVAFVLDLAARTATIVDALRAYEQEHVTAERNHVAQNFAEGLAGATTLDEVLDVVIRDAVAVLGASRSLVALVDEDRRNLRIVHESGYDEGVRMRWLTFPVDGELPLSEAVSTQSSVIVADRAERDRRYPALAAEPMDDHTLVCLPLIAEGERIGGVSLSYPAVRTLPEPEVQFLMAIASQAAQAIQRSLLFEERDRTAHVLQEALLPGELPKMPDVRLAAGYWPAGRRAEVGGDFYDVIENEDGFIAVIGDVCGRGPEAAAVMGLVRTSVRVLAARESSLPDLFGAVNRALLREVGDDVSTFVTLCGVTVVRPTNGPDAPLELEILCAGHPHPVLFGSDRPRGIGVSNLALGVVEDPPMVSVRARLADGEGLILYTDGLSERARDHVALEEDPELQGAIRAAYREGPEIFIQAVEEILGETHAKQDDAAVLILQALGA